MTLLNSEFGGRFPDYLGRESKKPKEPEGYLKSLTILNRNQAPTPLTHILVLGSVDLQLALDIRAQLEKSLSGRPRKGTTAELFDRAIRSVKLPKHREITYIQSPEDNISELRVRSPRERQTIDEIKAAVNYAHNFLMPLELMYANRPKKLESFHGWRSSSRQLEVLSVDSEGFTARHQRGIRRYLWRKVIRALVLEGDAEKLLPELCIEICVPYTPVEHPLEQSFRAEDFVTLNVHQLNSNYDLGKIAPQKRVALRQMLVKSWA